MSEGGGASKPAAFYSTVTSKVLHAFITSANLFGIAPQWLCAFPGVNTILVNFRSFVILSVIPAVLLSFVLCSSPPHPVPAVPAQPALPDPWPAVSEFLPSSICITSKESCWIVHLRPFWISEAILLLQWTLWHKQNPFFIFFFLFFFFFNRTNSGNWSLFVPFWRSESYSHYCTVSSSILWTAIWVM